MKKGSDFVRKLVFFGSMMLIFLLVLSSAVFKNPNSDLIHQFNASSTSESPTSWNQCEINPNNSGLTHLQIDAKITGLLSAGERISLLDFGSNSVIEFRLEAIGPANGESSRIQLSLFPSSDNTNILFLPLTNRKININLDFAGAAGRFSIGEEPNVIATQFTLSGQISCSTVRFPTMFEPDVFAPRFEDIQARLSQTSSSSLLSRWLSIDLYVFFVLLAFLGVVVSILSLRKIKLALPNEMQFFSFLTVQLAIAIPVLWAIGSYFNFDVFSSFMYTSKDGWCRSATEGIGDHCFGDWNERIAPNFFDHQFPGYSSSLETSPIGPFWTSAINFFASLTTPRASLYFSLVLAFFVGFVTVQIISNSSLPHRLVWFSLVLVGGYPWLVAVDRLHHSVFVLPFFALAVKGSIENNRVILGRSLVVLALYKPHLAILLLVFANSREWRFFFKYSVMAVGGVLALIALPSASPKNRIHQYILNVFYLSDYRPAGSTAYPPNLSIRRMLEIILSFGNLQENQLFLLSLIISCVGILFTVVLSPKGYFSSLLRLLPLVMFGVNGYVAAYYLLFSSVILLAVVSANPDAKSTVIDALRRSRLALMMFILALIISQSLIILPYGKTEFGGILTFTPLLASFSWVILSLFLNVLDTVRFFKPQPVEKFLALPINKT